jgi:tRNA (guanine-N7-)-methyltransferase
VKEELKIKTHYEGLDIARSQRVHYLQFTLPATLLPDLDEALQEKVWASEPDPSQTTSQ